MNTLEKIAASIAIATSMTLAGCASAPREYSAEAKKEIKSNMQYQRPRPAGHNNSDNGRHLYSHQYPF